MTISFFPSDSSGSYLLLTYKNEPYEYVLLQGSYFFELWGASGGGRNPGYGAYVSGSISFSKPQKLYFYIGQKGVNGKNTAFNGGGSGVQYGSSGGGATDIRLEHHSIGSFNSLKSRIIVAGGGGGSQSTDAYNCQGGSAGILEGLDGSQAKLNDATTITLAKGGEQTIGGEGGQGSSNGEKGKFGEGGDGSVGNTNGNGGGGGYFGGGGSATGKRITGSGAGGSSYISGFPGCKAILKNANETNLSSESFSESSIHYSGLYFLGIDAKSGNSIKWNNNGQITIRYLGNFQKKTCKKSSFHIDFVCIFVTILIDLKP